MIDRSILISIAEELSGTCAIGQNSIEQRCEDRGLPPLSIEDLAVIDELVFLCEGCGWWCGCDELDDSNDEQLCGDCANG